MSGFCVGLAGCCKAVTLALTSAQREHGLALLGAAQGGLMTQAESRCSGLIDCSPARRWRRFAWPFLLPLGRSVGSKEVYQGMISRLLKRPYLLSIVLQGSTWRFSHCLNRVLRLSKPAGSQTRGNLALAHCGEIEADSVGVLGCLIIKSGRSVVCQCEHCPSNRKHRTSLPPRHVERLKIWGPI